MDNVIEYIKYLIDHLDYENNVEYSKEEVRRMLLSIIGEIITNSDSKG